MCRMVESEGRQTTARRDRSFVWVAVPAALGVLGLVAVSLSAH